jgi:hypothetical protein
MQQGEIDEPLAIRDLKRFAVDSFDITSLESPRCKGRAARWPCRRRAGGVLPVPTTLPWKAHDVTVYEALPEPGGMLRMPSPNTGSRRRIEGEIDYIRRLGVEILCGMEVGGEKTAAGIRDACDALFVATGAPKVFPSVWKARP